jgi:hypothetical protein
VATCRVVIEVRGLYSVNDIHPSLYVCLTHVPEKNTYGDDVMFYTSVEINFEISIINLCYFSA